jgi:hypothetical protein
MQIISQGGKIVFETQAPKDQVSTEQLPAGVYVLSLKRTDGSRKVVRFVKK